MSNSPLYLFRYGVFTPYASGAILLSALRDCQSSTRITQGIIFQSPGLPYAFSSVSPYPSRLPLKPTAEAAIPRCASVLCVPTLPLPMGGLRLLAISIVGL